MIGMKSGGHDFAAERAQLRRMRLCSPQLLVLAGAVFTLCAGPALAQSEAPVTTAGSTAGGVPTATETAPTTVRQTPAPAQIQPMPDFRELEAAAEQGRRAPLLGDYHGEVSAVVGTNGLRGAAGRIVAHPTDNMTLDLRFSTIHQNGGLYDGYVYGPGARYRSRVDLLAPDPMGGDPTIPPGH